MFDSLFRMIHLDWKKHIYWHPSGFQSPTETEQNTTGTDTGLHSHSSTKCVCARRKQESKASRALVPGPAGEGHISPQPVHHGEGTGLRHLMAASGGLCTSVALCPQCGVMSSLYQCGVMSSPRCQAVWHQAAQCQVLRT